MATQMKTDPIVKNTIDLFGSWLQHQREMRELRDMNSGDFAHTARDPCVSPIAPRSTYSECDVGAGTKLSSTSKHALEPDGTYRLQEHH